MGWHTCPCCLKMLLTENRAAGCVVPGHDMLFMHGASSACCCHTSQGSSSSCCWCFEGKAQCHRIKRSEYLLAEAWQSRSVQGGCCLYPRVCNDTSDCALVSAAVQSCAPPTGVHSRPAQCSMCTCHASQHCTAQQGELSTAWRLRPGDAHACTAQCLGSGYLGAFETGGVWGIVGGWGGLWGEIGGGWGYLEGEGAVFGGVLDIDQLGRGVHMACHVVSPDLIPHSGRPVPQPCISDRLSQARS